MLRVIKLRSMFSAICVEALFGIFLASCSDVFVTKYENWQEMDADGAIRKGWIPEWLPKEAINIQEKHNLDTSELAFSFELPASTSLDLKILCADVLIAPKPRIKLPNFIPGSQGENSVKLCDGFYLYQSGKTIFVWKN